MSLADKEGSTSEGTSMTTAPALSSEAMRARVRRAYMTVRDLYRLYIARWMPVLERSAAEYRGRGPSVADELLQALGGDEDIIRFLNDYSRRWLSGVTMDDVEATAAMRDDVRARVRSFQTSLVAVAGSANADVRQLDTIAGALEDVLAEATVDADDEDEVDDLLAGLGDDTARQEATKRPAEGPPEDEPAAQRPRTGLTLRDQINDTFERMDQRLRETRGPPSVLPQQPAGPGLQLQFGVPLMRMSAACVTTRW